jgi:hypothetical protein
MRGFETNHHFTNLKLPARSGEPGSDIAGDVRGQPIPRGAIMKPPRGELDRRIMRDAMGADGRRSDRGMRTKGRVVLIIRSAVYRSGLSIGGARSSIGGGMRWSPSRGSWKSANQEGDPFRAGSL